MKRRSRTKSDRQGELVESGRQPPIHRLLDGKLVVTSTNVLDEGMAGDDDSGAVVLLESAYETKSCFQATMVGLKLIVGKAVGAVPGRWRQLLDHQRIRRCPVGHHLS